MDPLQNHFTESIVKNHAHKRSSQRTTTKSRYRRRTTFILFLFLAFPGGGHSLARFLLVSFTLFTDYSRLA